MWKAIVCILCPSHYRIVTRFVIYIVTYLSHICDMYCVKVMIVKRSDKLAWDMQVRTVDVTITSVREQDIILIVRHGIEDE
jgi:hypothetical protein